MNLTRAIFGADYSPIILTKDFTEVKHFFKNLKAKHTLDDEISWTEITSIYLFVYDDRYSVEYEMSWDIIVLDKENDEIVEQQHWADRVPGFFYCQPLSLKDFLELNKDYCSVSWRPFILDDD